MKPNGSPKEQGDAAVQRYQCIIFSKLYKASCLGFGSTAWLKTDIVIHCYICDINKYLVSYWFAGGIRESYIELKSGLSWDGRTKYNLQFGAFMRSNFPLSNLKEKYYI